MPGNSSAVSSGGFGNSSAVSSGGFGAASFMPAPSAVPWVAAPSDTAAGGASMKVEAAAAAAAATATAVVAFAQNQAYAMLAEAFYLQQQQLGQAALLPGHFGTAGSGGAPHGEWSEMHETPADAWVNEWCAPPPPAAARIPQAPPWRCLACSASQPAPRPPPSSRPRPLQPPPDLPPPSTRPRSLADRPGHPISQAS